MGRVYPTKNGQVACQFDPSELQRLTRAGFGIVHSGMVKFLSSMNAVVASLCQRSEWQIPDLCLFKVDISTFDTQIPILLGKTQSNRVCRWCNGATSSFFLVNMYSAVTILGCYLIYIPYYNFYWWLKPFSGKTPCFHSSWLFNPYSCTVKSFFRNIFVSKMLDCYLVVGKLYS